MVRYWEGCSSPHPCLLVLCQMLRGLVRLKPNKWEGESHRRCQCSPAPCKVLIIGKSQVGLEPAVQCCSSCAVCTQEEEEISPKSPLKRPATSRSLASNRTGLGRIAIPVRGSSLRALRGNANAIQHKPRRLRL